MNIPIAPRLVREKYPTRKKTMNASMLPSIAESTMETIMKPMGFSVGHLLYFCNTKIKAEALN